MTNVIIEVSGGVVQAVYSDDADLRVLKVDWDAGESPGDKSGVGVMFVDRMRDLPATTRDALRVLE